MDFLVTRFEATELNISASGSLENCQDSWAEGA